MAWTEIAQRNYRRDGERYAGYLTEVERALIDHLLSSRFTTRSPTRSGTAISREG